MSMMSRRKLSVSQGRWNRCSRADDRRTNACCIVKSQQMQCQRSWIRKIFRALHEWVPTSEPLHRHITSPRVPWCNNACYMYDVTMRAITVMNLNPPLDPPLQFLRFILSNIAVHCILRENICIYALNKIPAPRLLQTCLCPCIWSRQHRW